MKMHYYLRSWKLDVTKSSKFLHTTIRQIINHSHTSMVSKAKSSTAKNALARFDVPKAHVLWLGTHAFQTVFSRKSHVYSQVLKTLAFDLSLPRYRQFKRRFRKVTNAGLDMFTLLTF
ncbi:hypothetical protein BXZ70DRAFT_892838 [Cristinia sonorae]|uniref:Uncharacterized protein n=1 Tax=Cristinia sonorae TaxID=1940300 RepID=A0A8K0XQ41_9AGAR|nr:hypothetical protein BXZ70DRAFT_892838 [Cristinia sonorae]